MSKKNARHEPTDAGPESGKFAYNGLERVLHEKARLGIMTSIFAHSEGLLFGDLKELCALTDGNLSRHLQVLHDAGLVEIWKSFQNKRPQTLCRLTPQGRARFLTYVEELEKVLSTVEACAETPVRRASAGDGGHQRVVIPLADSAVPDLGRHLVGERSRMVGDCGGSPRCLGNGSR